MCYNRKYNELEGVRVSLWGMCYECIAKGEVKWRLWCVVVISLAKSSEDLVPRPVLVDSRQVDRADSWVPTDPFQSPALPTL